MTSFSFMNVQIECFKIFGVVPLELTTQKPIIVQKVYSIIVFLFLTAYWSEVSYSIWFSNPSLNQISVVSNHVQLVINGLAMTVVHVLSIFGVKKMHIIRSKLHKFDVETKEVNLKIKDRKMNLTSTVCISFMALFVIYSTILDFYVTIIRYQRCTIFYWIVTLLPSFIYITSLFFAFCLIINTYYRWSMLNDFLCKALLTKTSLKIQKINVEPRKDSSSSIARVFYLINDLTDLTNCIGRFFGPIFLATFTAFFVISTIQIFYCYVLLTSVTNESKGYSGWTLAISSNTVIFNIIMVLTIITICEGMSYQVLTFFTFL
ncbi:unnamed protein product [Diamesa hyperborea]